MVLDNDGLFFALTGQKVTIPKCLLLPRMIVGHESHIALSSCRGGDLVPITTLVSLQKEKRKVEKKSMRSVQREKRETRKKGREEQKRRDKQAVCVCVFPSDCHNLDRQTQISHSAASSVETN